MFLLVPNKSQNLNLIIKVFFKHKQKDYILES